MATPSSATSTQKQELYEHIVDAFNAIFGITSWLPCRARKGHRVRGHIHAGRELPPR